MTLDEYLKGAGLSTAAGARLLKLSESAVARLRRGRTYPTRETAARIARLTEGKVSANDFLAAAEREPRGGKAGRAPELGMIPVRRKLPARPIDPRAFAPFGHLSRARPDGGLFGPDDAPLDLSGGKPRFFIMRLVRQPLVFQRMARHCLVTQCLGALGGKDWLIAVAPPGDLADASAMPRLDDVAAFVVPGDAFVMLHKGTWHAGPYIRHKTADFYNLQLADTDDKDHRVADLGRVHATEFVFA